MLLDKVHENFQHFQSFQKVTRKIDKYTREKLSRVIEYCFCCEIAPIAHLSSWSLPSKKQLHRALTAFLFLLKYFCFKILEKFLLFFLHSPSLKKSQKIKDTSVNSAKIIKIFFTKFPIF